TSQTTRRPRTESRTRHSCRRASRSILPSRESHQFVGRHAGDRAVRAAQMLDEALPARLASLLLSDSHAVAHDVEFNLAVRQHAEAFANVLRDGHLAFGRDAHGITPTSNTTTARTSTGAARRRGRSR